MSLDVYLNLPGIARTPEAMIPIREEGDIRMLTRAEWDQRFPGRDPVVMTSGETDEVYAANITHNLSEMANEAGLYTALWRPDANDMLKASDLIIPLQAGLNLLLSAPDRFKAFNPANGWGSYDGLVDFVRDYLHACQNYPNADVSVSR